MSSSVAPVSDGKSRHTPEMQRSPPRVPPAQMRIDDAVVKFHVIDPLKKCWLMRVDGRVVHS
jgi:hypothetical protein